MRLRERFDNATQDTQHGRFVAWCGRVLIACSLLLICHSRVFAQQPPAAPATTSATPSAAAPAAKSPVAQPAQTAVQPWEYSPYRIRVWLSAAAAPEFHPTVLADIRRDVHLRADSVVGSPWMLTVEPPPAAIAATMAYAPESITAAEIGKVQKEVLQGDKLIWITLQADEREMRVLARELDCHTRTWGQTLVQPVRQPAALSRAVFDAILAVFCPLARIEDGQGKNCTVRVRAAGLALSQDSPIQIGKGDVLQPVFRQNDRFGEPIKDRIHVIQFTFIQVTGQSSLNPSLLECVVHSSIRSPIQGRPMSRRERWALKVRPFLPATELVVESRPYVRNEPIVRLAGLEVYAKTPLVNEPKAETEEERAAAEKRNPPELIGTTDWRGTLTIPNQGLGLRIMYIKNGGLLLARLPMIAGLEGRMVAEVPDDDPRLQAEGFVKGINGEITDLVVQRQLIRVRVRKKIDQRKFDDAQKMIEELRGLKTMQDLQRTLDQQVARQIPTNSPGVRQRIEKLYAEERELIAKYVDVDIVNQLTADLAAARAAPAPTEEKEEGIDVITPPPEKKEEGKKKEELPSALQKKE